MKIIQLTNSPLVIQVDDNDYLYLVLLTNWSIGGSGYPQSTRKPRIFLNNYFKEKLNIKGEIDHKDRNKLNYQRENLRDSTHSQNAINQVRINQRRYKGVRYHPLCITKPYEASITVNKIRLYLGYFSLEEDAAIAYNKAALLHFGEFAVLNEVSNGKTT